MESKLFRQFKRICDMFFIYLLVLNNYMELKKKHKDLLNIFILPNLSLLSSFIFKVKLIQALYTKITSFSKKL